MISASSSAHVHAVSAHCFIARLDLFGVSCFVVSPLKRYIISLRFVPSSLVLNLHASSLLPPRLPSPTVFLCTLLVPPPPQHILATHTSALHRRASKPFILKRCSDSFCTATLSYINPADPVATLHPLVITAFNNSNTQSSLNRHHQPCRPSSPPSALTSSRLTWPLTRARLSRPSVSFSFVRVTRLGSSHQ